MTDVEQRHQEIFELTPVALWEQDLTQVHAALAALRAAGVTDFRQHFAAHPEIVASLASKISILDANQQALELLGASTKQELLGTLDALFHAQDSPAWPALREQLVALAEGTTRLEIETSVRTLQGTPRQVLLTLTVLDTSPPRVTGLVSMTDLADQKRVAEALHSTHARLERSQHELEDFAYLASSDLQEPLRTIDEHMQQLASAYAGKIDEKADKYIHYVTDGARRMQRLISDLLELSTVGLHGKPLEPTDCNQVVAQVLQSMQGTIEERAARVTHDALPVVLADALQLAQLFQHLISNGIKFCREPVPQVHVSAHRQGAEWILSVADHGIGIEEKYFQDIFLAFKRLHGLGEYPGTGMGLAIAKRLAERHGGRIWVESQPGQGSTFHVALQAAPGADQRSEVVTTEARE